MQTTRARNDAWIAGGKAALRRKFNPLTDDVKENASTDKLDGKRLRKQY